MAKSMSGGGYQSGASRIGALDQVDFGVPALPLRDYYALHAPPPPQWWRVRTPVDVARWCWTWADAMLKTRELPTTPESADSK